MTGQWSILTALSIPSVMSMTKKRMDHPTEPGSVAMASG